MSNYSVELLEKKALAIRRSIITMLAAAKSGHSGGALGMADVFTALYFEVLTHDPKQPEDPARDRLLLSNGHICPVWYATLAEAGYFPKQELFTLRRLNSRLQGHPHLGSAPGIENTSGPLAQGLSQACGVALAFKMDSLPNRVYCVMSDGELEEGQNWEALMLGGKYKLKNLTVLIDRNNIQIDGFTNVVMPLEPLRSKIESFNWHVVDVDGHNFSQIIHACEAAATTEYPTVIICRTIPGKGVDFMENKYEWHGKPPTEEQAEQALAQLKETNG
jgi:transketolase